MGRVEGERKREFASALKIRPASMESWSWSRKALQWKHNGMGAISQSILGPRSGERHFSVPPRQRIMDENLGADEASSENFDSILLDTNFRNHLSPARYPYRSSFIPIEGCCHNPTRSCVTAQRVFLHIVRFFIKTTDLFLKPSLALDYSPNFSQVIPGCPWRKSLRFKTSAFLIVRLSRDPLGQPLDVQRVVLHQRVTPLLGHSWRNRYRKTSTGFIYLDGGISGGANSGHTNVTVSISTDNL